MTNLKEPWKLPLWRSGPTFLYSQRPLARYIGRPAAEFLKIEPSGGIVLLVSAVIALLWANSPWASTYDAVWGLEITVGFGDFVITHTFKEWINDGLMALFFFVVGLEIKSEIASGELRDPRNAVAPIAAAVGGMVVPAGIYAMLNAGGDGIGGWGIPMATDIAFALGIVALFGKSIPSPARIFLLTLAIVDDLGAITVIAVFYTQHLEFVWLAAAVGIAGVAVLMRVLHVWSAPVYVVLGIGLWLCTLESGIHATIAGVVMGLLMSAKPLVDPSLAKEHARQIAKLGPSAERSDKLIWLVRESMPPSERIQHRLHPFSSFVVLPLFALANAGVPLTPEVLGNAVASPVTLGIASGLVVGKIIGITGATWLVVRSGWARLPSHTSWPMMIGIAAVGGVGFTVALFITELAFRGGDAVLLTDEAKIGVLAGSFVAACLGASVLRLATRKLGERRDAVTDEG
jgi:NhaA family Na+:H+ antiporter